MQAEGQLARDQANLANARIDIGAVPALADQEMIARQQLDTQRMVVNRPEATMKMNAGSIDAIKLQLIYCRITSPITGRAGLRLVDPGNVVRRPTRAGSSSSRSSSRSRSCSACPRTACPRSCAASARDAGARRRLRPRGPRRSWPRARSPPSTTRSIPRPAPVRVKAQFVNKDGVLYPNQFVNARVLIDVLHDALLAPAEAIQRGRRARSSTP
jgi:multidrug efflux system membrane fusion protein